MSEFWYIRPEVLAAPPAATRDLAVSGLARRTRRACCLLGVALAAAVAASQSLELSSDYGQLAEAVPTRCGTRTCLFLRAPRLDGYLPGLEFTVVPLTGRQPAAARYQVLARAQAGLHALPLAPAAVDAGPVLLVQGRSRMPVFAVLAAPWRKLLGRAPP
jgi:hypothetical protein